MYKKVLIILDCNWRASEASETLSGVTQLKIGDICLLAKVWSQRLCTFTIRKGLINSFEVFCLCTGSLAHCAQAHH